MSSFKQIDNNPEFVFEFTPDMENYIKAMFEKDYLVEWLNRSTEHLPNGKIRWTILIEDSSKATVLSYALRAARIKFYTRNDLNMN